MMQQCKIDGCLADYLDTLAAVNAERRQWGLAMGYERLAILCDPHDDSYPVRLARYKAGKTCRGILKW